jgi:hypothetical protein
VPYASLAADQSVRGTGDVMTMRTKSRWLACVALTAAVGIGATAVVVGTAGAASSTKPTKHRNAGSVTTASFTFSVSVSGLTPSPVTISGSGAADGANHGLSLTVDLPDTVAKLLPGGSNAPEVVQAVLSGGTVYLNVPSLAPLVGEPWISVALPAKAVKTIPGVLSKIGSAIGNVSAIVQYAQAHHATVTSLGTATVDGVSATGNQIVAALSAKQIAGTLTASVWADSSNRLVQANVSLTNTGQSALAVSAKVDLSGYGAPVTITIPPASETKAVPYSVVAKFLGQTVGKVRHH